MAEPMRNALIVGFGPGVGQAVALAFAAEGYSIALLARGRDKVEAAASAFAATGAHAAGFAADAGDETSLNAALAAARRRFGDPDVLVYNAAHWRPGPVLALRPEALLDDFRICTVGALVAARAVAPAMTPAGRGTILFTGGGFALFPSSMAPALSIGKAAIRALDLMLAQELAPAGIRRDGNHHGNGRARDQPRPGRDCGSLRGAPP